MEFYCPVFFIEMMHISPCTGGEAKYKRAFLFPLPTSDSAPMPHHQIGAAALRAWQLRTKDLST